MLLIVAALLLAACAGRQATTATTAASPVTVVNGQGSATATLAATPSPRPTATDIPAPTVPATGEAAPTAELPALDEPPPGLLLALENSAGGWGLWLVGEDSSLHPLLQEIAAPTHFPDFHVSPDGQQLLYAYQGDIWHFDVATGAAENVTQTEDRLESAPRWLPGNTEQFVAGSFSVAEAGPSVGYLTLIGFDGSYELLDKEGSMTAPPAPSPDGKTIAYSKGQPSLYHLEGPESGRRPLDLASFGLGWAEKAGAAAWSPDGSRLAWTLLGSPDDSHQALLALLDPATSDYQALMTYTPAGIGGMPPAPLWSPDGDGLLAAPLSFEPETRGLWLFDLHGGTTRLTEQAPRLSHTPNPALSPDGRRLAFSTGTSDAVGVINVGAWQPRFWQPPDRVAAVGWATARPPAGVVQQAETPPAPTLTPPSAMLDPATRPATGIVTPPAKAAEALLPYEPTGGVPAEIDAWAWYAVRYSGLTLPIPPEWIVREWSYDDAHVFYSATIQPPLWADPAECGYQCPEISVAVWRLPPAANLQAWLAQHGTSAPFGSEASQASGSIFFTGVDDIQETRVGDAPALAFYDEAMGIRSVSIIFELDGVIVSLRKSHVDHFEFEPVFDFMRRHARTGDHDGS